MGVAKWWVLVGIGMLSVWVPNPAQAQQAPGGVTPKNGAPPPPSRARSVVDEQALTELYGAAKGNPTPGGPRIHQTADGFLRFFGSAPTASYQLKSTPLAQDPESIAKGFVSDYAGAFYTPDNRMGFETDSVTTESYGDFVRLQQTYDDILVSAAMMVVQVLPDGSVASVLSDIMRNAFAFQSGKVDTTSSLSAADAETLSIFELSGEYPDTILTVTDLGLAIFVGVLSL